MPIPTIEALVTEFGAYVSTTPASNSFVQSSVEKAVAYLGTKPLTTVGEATVEDGFLTPGGVELKIPEETYREEVMELAADIFYRRQAQNGVVSINALEGVPVRVARDPYKACDERLVRWVGLGFA